MLMWWVHLWKKLTSPFAASNLPVHFCIERSVWFWIIQLTHPLQTLTTWQILAPLSCLLRLSAPWYLCSLIPTNFLPPSRDWEWYYMLWWHFLLTAPGPNKTFHLLTVEIISSVLLYIQIYHVSAAPPAPTPSLLSIFFRPSELFKPKLLVLPWAY